MPIAQTRTPPLRRPLRPLLGAVLLAALLPACATLGPDHVAPQTTVPPAWQGVERSAGAVEISAWWLQLGDPQLSQLIEAAFAANPDYARSRAVLREARARVGVVGAARLPEVGVGASVGYSKSGELDSVDRYSAGLDAAWEIDLFGVTRRSVEAAEADFGRAEANVDDARVSLAAEVGLNYVTLRSAQSRLAIARANLASQGETLQLTDWRVQAGLASSVDLEQARSSHEQTLAALPRLETLRNQAANALAVLTGATPQAMAAELALPGALPKVPEHIAIGIPAETLRRRPDLRAAERALAAETARIGVATANLYPALRLSGSIGTNALTLGALGGAASITRSLLASLSGTLFDGGRLQGQLEAQGAVREQAWHAYQASVLGALQEVEDALVAFENERLSTEALTRAASAARNAALLARQRYQSGLIDFQTVLDTERSLLSVDDNLASSQAERVSSLIRLYKALGGGWSAAPATAGGSTS